MFFFDAGLLLSMESTRCEADHREAGFQHKTRDRTHFIDALNSDRSNLTHLETRVNKNA